MRVLASLIAGFLCILTMSTRAEPEPPLHPLDRDALLQDAAKGIDVLNKLYWSPTLGIWLDRTGDDLRAHYEGRRNPPWWSSANAVEALIDYMDKSGTNEFDHAIAELYELHKTPHATAERLVAELKRRNQWNAEDEAKWQRRTSQASGASGEDDKSYTEFRNEYLDDSGWWGIAWLKMYDRTHEAKYLETAKAIHKHMAKNWKPEKEGGVVWCEDADKQRPNSITNSLFVILSARLYARTQQAEDLDWAQKGLAWMHEKKVYDGTGVVDAPGHHGDYWSYNQGAFIGGLLSLFEATGKVEYLDEASQTADGVLVRAGLVLPSGVFVEKLGTKGWDPGLFKGIMVRYLGQLRDLLKARGLHAETMERIDRCLQASAASIEDHTIGADGEFTVDWQDGGKDKAVNFNSQTSGIIALVAAAQEKVK